MIRLLVTLFAGLFGLAFGSFLNVCLSRWPMGESVVAPRSHCRTCARTLNWWENIPLLSWIALRGRCRTCKEAISWRYPLVEAAVGGLWAVVAWQSADAFFPVEFSVGRMVFLWLLVALAVFDSENLWLPDRLTLPGVALGLFWWTAQGLQIGWALRMPTELHADAFEIGERILGIAVAAGFILLVRWLYWIIRHREGLGLGDAKLMALLAAWLGLPGAALAFVVAVGLGTLAALVVLLQPRRKGEPWAQVKLPLGTFLCLGGIVSAFWGQPLIAFYMKWAGM